MKIGIRGVSYRALQRRGKLKVKITETLRRIFDKTGKTEFQSLSHYIYTQQDAREGQNVNASFTTLF